MGDILPFRSLQTEDDLWDYLTELVHQLSERADERGAVISFLGGRFALDAHGDWLVMGYDEWYPCEFPEILQHAALMTVVRELESIAFQGQD